MRRIFDNRRFRLCLPAILLATVAAAWTLLFPVQQPDYALYLKPWLTAIRNSEGLEIFATGFTNYTGAYVTILWMFERLDVLAGGLLSDLTVIKLAAVTGSLLCAAGAYMLLMTLKIQRHNICAAAVGLLLLPEILLNGVAWGQTDALYAAFLLFTLAAMLNERAVLAGLYFAFAISVKLQAIWFAPVLAGWILRRPRAILPALAAVPAVYLLVNLLYLIAGRPIQDVLSIYFRQFGTFDRLSMNAPNFWSLIDPIVVAKDLSAYYPPLAITGTTLAFVAAIWIIWRTYHLEENPGTQLLYWATVSTLSMPFLLPKMHDRFFITGGILAYLLAVMDRRYIVPAMLVQAATVLAYSHYHDTLGLLALFGKASIRALAVVLMTIAWAHLLRLRPASAL